MHDRSLFKLSSGNRKGESRFVRKLSSQQESAAIYGDKQPDQTESKKELTEKSLKSEQN